MAMTRKIEANPCNAQESNGVSTPEGESRSRLGALGPGKTARPAVLPGEDEAAYFDRIMTWKGQLRPQGAVEDYLVERAARVSWQVDRADRVQLARLASRIRNVPAAEAHEQAGAAAALGRRLWDAGAALPMGLDPAARAGQPWTSTSPSAPAIDPDHPAVLVHRLEATEAGCHWLRDRWAALRGRLERGLGWNPTDKFRAIRLLGKRPMDLADDPAVAEIFLVCNVLQPASDPAFRTLCHDFFQDKAVAAQRRLAWQEVQKLLPRDEPSARRWLVAIVDRAVGRLEELAAGHRRRAEADADQAVDRLAFDESPAGEQLRRYGLACGRTMLRTLDLVLKIRQVSSPAGAARAAVRTRAHAHATPTEVREQSVSQPGLSLPAPPPAAEDQGEAAGGSRAEGHDGEQPSHAQDQSDPDRPDGPHAPCTTIPFGSARRSGPHATRHEHSAPRTPRLEPRKDHPARHTQAPTHKNRADCQKNGRTEPVLRRGEETVWVARTIPKINEVPIRLRPERGQDRDRVPQPPLARKGRDRAAPQRPQNPPAAPRSSSRPVSRRRKAT